MALKSSFEIRLGKLDDLFQIGNVFADSVQELCKNDYDQNTIIRWIESKPPEARTESIKNKSLWVAENGGEVAGYLVSIPGEIIALFIGSSYSGLGLGLALGKLGIEIAKSDGTKGVKLESTITAAPFYKKMGFKEVSRGYYTHDQSDLKLPIINMALS